MVSDTCLGITMELLVLAVFAGVAFGVQRAYSALSRRRLMASLRRRYSARFKRDSESVELAEYVRVISENFPGLRSDPLSILRPQLADEAWLATVVAAGADRFDIPLECIRWAFTSNPSGLGSAGRCVLPAKFTLQFAGDTLTVRSRDTTHDHYQIEVADRYRADPEAAAVIVGHELAHIALWRRGIARQSRLSDERLTDVAAAMAGFGDLMVAVSRRERWTESGERVSLRVGTTGYLHRDAIQHLWDRYLAPRS
ncbi:MAG TPA: hypothetical protein VLD17_16275 [Gemmatimonadaceae bacterium]|nr:hypothetical protein [Gemmatimonadaceae bacterium]